MMMDWTPETEEQEMKNLTEDEDLTVSHIQIHKHSTSLTQFSNVFIFNFK